VLTSWVGLGWVGLGEEKWTDIHLWLRDLNYRTNIANRRAESSRVWTFVVGAELAVQSQQRRTMVRDTHVRSQHWLMLEQVGLELALE